jgi:hypothetical protein
VVHLLKDLNLGMILDTLEKITKGDAEFSHHNYALMFRMSEEMF